MKPSPSLSRVPLNNTRTKILRYEAGSHKKGPLSDGAKKRVDYLSDLRGDQNPTRTSQMKPRVRNLSAKLSVLMKKIILADHDAELRSV